MLQTVFLLRQCDPALRSKLCAPAVVVPLFTLLIIAAMRYEKDRLLAGQSSAAGG
jgi:hypothetical protein